MSDCVYPVPGRIHYSLVWFSNNLASLKRDSKASFASPQVDSVKGFLAIRTPLYPGLISWINSRKAARIIRFVLLRLTAFPTEIPAVTANRESG